MTGQRFLTQLAISVGVAIAMPAVAAGLMASVAAAADATNTTSTIYSADESAGAVVSAGASPFVATHAPAKLSVLVGDDDAAWASAHSVHIVRKGR